MWKVFTLELELGIKKGLRHEKYSEIKKVFADSEKIAIQEGNIS